MIINTKFSIGNKVFAADIHRTLVAKLCPDCLGKKEWQAQLPSGKTIPVKCPSCTGWNGPPPDIVYIPTTRILTVGSVRYDSWRSKGWEAECPVSYMMEETGVGSGTIWSEYDLFASDAEAQQKAAAKAAVANANVKRQAEEEAARKAHFPYVEKVESDA